MSEQEKNSFLDLLSKYIDRARVARDDKEFWQLMKAVNGKTSKFVVPA
jgi:hypothetical protein